MTFIDRQHARFAAKAVVCLQCRRRWYFFVVFLGTPPVYSIVSRIPSLQHSLADIPNWGTGMYVFIAICKLPVSL